MEVLKNPFVVAAAVLIAADGVRRFLKNPSKKGLAFMEMVPVVLVGMWIYTDSDFAKKREEQKFIRLGGKPAESNP